MGKRSGSSRHHPAEAGFGIGPGRAPASSRGEQWPRVPPQGSQRTRPGLGRQSGSTSTAPHSLLASCFPATSTRRRYRAGARAHPSEGRSLRRRLISTGTRCSGGSSLMIAASTSVMSSACERRSPGQHFVEHAAERPDVGALVDRLAARLLGAHVGRGAKNHAAPASSRAR